MIVVLRCISETTEPTVIFLIMSVRNDPKFRMATWYASIVPVVNIGYEINVTYNCEFL